MKKLITLVLAAVMLTSCTAQSMTPTSESYMAKDLQMLSYIDYLPSDTTDEEKNSLFLDVGLDELTEEEFELYFESVRALTEFNDSYDDAGTGGIVAAVKVNYVYTAAEMKRVFDLVCMNHPEFFWLDKNYDYTTRSTYTTMNYYAVDEYTDKNVRLDDKNSLDEQVKNCIRLLSGERDEYGMIKIAHDYICDTTKYAYDENGDPLHDNYTSTPIGALVKKSAICEGYAEAFQLILRECGIKCTNVVGISEGTPGNPESHQWNAVLLDGEWYLVDTTWDAANDGETIYTYFLIGSDNLPHITDTEEQGQFWLPEISDTDYVASDEEYDRFIVTTVDPDNGYIKLYNKNIEVEGGTEVCEGTELTVKLIDSFYKFTVLLNGTAIEGESFVVEEDTKVSLLLSNCGLSGIELPYVENVVASNSSPLSWRVYYTDIYTDTGFTDYAYIEWDLTDYNAKKTSDGMPYDFVSTGTLELPGGVTATPEKLTLVRNVHVSGYYRQPKVTIPEGYVLEITDKDGNILNGNIEYGTEISFMVKDFSGYREADIYYGSSTSDMTLLEDDSAEMNVNFSNIRVEVKDSAIISVADIEDSYAVENGTPATAYSLGLPISVEIDTDTGKRPASINWDLSGYDINDPTARELTVTGEVILPSGIANENEISLSVSTVLDISEADEIDTILTEIPTELNVNDGTAITPLALGLPDRITFTDTDGNEHEGILEWTRNGDAPEYTFTAKLIAPGFDYNEKIETVVRVTDGFEKLPVVNLVITDENGDSVTTLEHFGKNQYDMTMTMTIFPEHSGRSFRIVIPDGFTIDSYPNASLIAEVDEFTYSKQGNDNVFDIVISDDIGDTLATIIIDIKATQICEATYEYSNYRDCTHDFGYIYRTGQEIPVTYEYTATENGKTYTVALRPQQEITIRDDYDMSMEGGKLFTVPSTIANLDALNLYYGSAKWDFPVMLNGNDHPHLSYFKAIIPMPDELESFEVKNYSRFVTIEKQGNSIILTAPDAQSLYTTMDDGYYRQKLHQALEINSITTADYITGAVMRADMPITYIFADSFGNEYVYDTGKYMQINTMPEGNEVLGVRGNYVSASPYMSTNLICEVTYSKTSGASTSLEFDYDIEIDIPDGVKLERIWLEDEYDDSFGFGDITAIYQDGTQELVIDGVIVDNTSENRVTKVIINKSGLNGQDNSTAEVVFDVTAFDTYSDGSPIEFAYDYSDECDSDVYRTTVKSNLSNATASDTTDVDFVDFYFDTLTVHGNKSEVWISSSEYTTTYSTVKIDSRRDSYYEDSPHVSHDNLYAVITVPEEVRDYATIERLDVYTYEDEDDDGYTSDVIFYYTDGTSDTQEVPGTYITYNFTPDPDKTLEKIEVWYDRFGVDGISSITVYTKVDNAEFAKQRKENSISNNIVYPVTLESDNIDNPFESQYHGSVTAYIKDVANYDYSISGFQYVTLIDPALTVHSGFEQTDYRKESVPISIGGGMTAPSELSVMANAEELVLSIDADDKIVLDTTGVTIKDSAENIIEATDVEVTKLTNGRVNYKYTFKDVKIKIERYSAIIYLNTGFTPTFDATKTEYKLYVMPDSYITFEDMDYTEIANHPYVNKISVKYSKLKYEQSGKIPMSYVSSEIVDNTGATENDDTIGNGPYTVMGDDEFSYIVYMFSKQINPLNDVELFVNVPREGNTVETLNGESDPCEWSAYIKDVIIETSGTDSNFKVYYTTDTPSDDNDETYAEFSSSLSKEILESITKIKVTADKAYTLDNVSFVLEYLSGAETDDETCDVYMACDYSYTSSNSNVGFEGKTASVSYHFDFYTVTYDINGGIGEAPVDNNGYSTGDTVELIDADELTTEDGRMFLGWATSSDSREVVDSVVIENSNVVLYAVYYIPEYMLKPSKTEIDIGDEDFREQTKHEETVEIKSVGEKVPENIAVEVTEGSEWLTISDLITNNDGTMSFDISVPDDLEIGQYTATVTITSDNTEPITITVTKDIIDTRTVIEQVDVEGYTVPVFGQTVAENLENVKVPDNADYTADSFMWGVWSDEHGDYIPMSETDVFEEGKKYSFRAILIPDENFIFSETAQLLINGETDDVAENSWSNKDECYILSECEAQDNKVVIEEAGFVNYKQPVAGDTVADLIASLGLVNYDQYSPIDEPGIACAELDENYSMVGGLLGDDYVFEVGKTYALLTILEPNEGYKFSVDETALTVNGGTDLLYEESNVASENEAMLIVTFTVVDEPTEDEPTEDEPTENEPTEDEPTEDEPTEDEPTEDEPTEDEPTEDEPTEDEPSDDNVQTGTGVGLSLAGIALAATLMVASKKRALRR